MKTSIPLLVLVACLLLMPQRTTASPGYSPNITVDTRGEGDVTVTGRVLDAEANTPLEGAAIGLAGLSTASAANGTFTLANVNLTGAGTLQASAAGFVPQPVQVLAGAGVQAVDVGNILLSPVGNGPQVEWVKLDPEACFLSGFGTTFQAKARVNWNGFTPQSVVFSANGVTVHTASGPGPEYVANFSVDTHFQPSLQAGKNGVSVVATGLPPGLPTAPQAALPRQVDVAVLPLPAALQAGSKSSEGLNLKVSFAFPSTKPVGLFSLPVLGSMGGEASVAGAFTYNFRSNQWTVEAGGEFEGQSTKYSAFKLRLGPLEDIKAEIKGKASGTATRAKGIDLSSLEISSTLELSGKFALGSYGPFSLLGPQLTNVVLDTPVLNKAFRGVSVILWLKPGLAGEATLQAYPQLSFKGFGLTGKTALEAAYEPELGKIKAKFYVGGEPSVKFGLPSPFFREMRFKAYAGLKATIWIWDWETEYVFVDVSHPAGASSPMARSLFAEGGQVLAAKSNETATWQVTKRPWRAGGEEVFLPAAEGPLAVGKSAEFSVLGSGLEAFIRMGQATSAAAAEGAGTVVARIIANDPGLPVQAEFPLLENVLPGAEPALAGKGDELMLLYVRDTGAVNPVQFTEVAFSHFNGTAWTAPAPIAVDVRGQFSPQVVFDGGGNAIAVYERIKDGAFAGTVMTDMAALLEIVWSRWDAVTKTWSVPQAITNNAFLDFSPKLSGPLTDGDLLLTWNQSETNQIDGTGVAGAATNLRVMTRRWDLATQTWGGESVLVPDLTGELSECLAASADKGVYVWSVDMDGNTDDSADAELFYRLYNATTDTWGPTLRQTNDAVADRHAKAAVDAVGNVYVIWNRDGALVMDVNFSGTPTLARAGADGQGVADFALTLGPGGNLVLIWQEMTGNGSDAHYLVYDPASTTWGQPSLLSEDADLERSFAPVWDAAGNLTLAYNNVVVTKQTVSVAVEGGGTVEVDGVPQPGRVDLLLAKRTLVKDLAVVPEGLTADGTDFLPGDALTLKARVKNTGNLAVENVQVAFYNGDPANGGALIGTATDPGWLEAATEAEVTVNWTVPQPAQPRTIHIKIDPTAAVTESDETNNALALPINGVDLALEYQSGSVLRDGSARVVVKVKNLSAPESPVSMLKLKTSDTSSTLAEISVSQLAPGQSVEVPFDLPAGTHPEGDRGYVLVIDEENLTEDIDVENNEALFNLNLWIDDDGDGIPRWWEQANGLSDGSFGDATSDADGDGFDARSEYLAGTDPRNAASRLAVGQFNMVTNAVGGTSTTTVSWASVSGRLYRVERSFDLTQWTIVSDNVEPTPPLNSVTDEVLSPDGRVFYRIVVE